MWSRRRLAPVRRRAGLGFPDVDALYDPQLDPNRPLSPLPLPEGWATHDPDAEDDSGLPPSSRGPVRNPSPRRRTSAERRADAAAAAVAAATAAAAATARADADAEALRSRLPPVPPPGRRVSPLRPAPAGSAPPRLRSVSEAKRAAEAAVARAPAARPRAARPRGKCPEATRRQCPKAFTQESVNDGDDIAVSSSGCSYWYVTKNNRRGYCNRLAEEEDFFVPTKEPPPVPVPPREKHAHREAAVAYREKKREHDRQTDPRLEPYVRRPRPDPASLLADGRPARRSPSARPGRSGDRKSEARELLLAATRLQTVLAELDRTKRELALARTLTLSQIEKRKAAEQKAKRAARLGLQAVEAEERARGVKKFKPGRARPRRRSATSAAALKAGLPRAVRPRRGARAAGFDSDPPMDLDARPSDAWRAWHEKRSDW